MRTVHAVVILAIIAAMTWLMTLQMTPRRVTTIVTVYDTVHVVVPINRSGQTLQLCTPDIRRSVDMLGETSFWHDMPMIVQAACGAIGQGLPPRGR